MSTYVRFNQEDDIISANPTEVTLGLWPGDTGSLTAFFTSSQAIGQTSGQYYWEIRNKSSSDSTGETCFAVAYGHRTGAGHPTLAQSDTSTLATQAVYAQYRQLLLDPGDTQFTFYGSYNTDHIYVINIQRNRIKERFDPGNWELSLSGSNGRRTFIDDSGQGLGAAFGRSGQVFNVVSGSLSGSLGYTIAASGSATKGGFGLVYPSLGIIVLNPDALVETVGFTASADSRWQSPIPFAPFTGSTTSAQYNHAALYYSMKLAATPPGTGDFQARSAENISSTHYFVRLKAKDFNYSNNPTFFDEIDGTLTHTTMIQDPRVYPTTVGLYNDNFELLAVAKLSKPIQKGFDKELNVKVRLDY